MQAQELKTRLPVGVKNWLSVRAAGNDRSMNAELVNILKMTMKAELPAILKNLVFADLEEQTFENANAPNRDLSESIR